MLGVIGTWAREIGIADLWEFTCGRTEYETPTDKIKVSRRIRAYARFSPEVNDFCVRLSAEEERRSIL